VSQCVIAAAIDICLYCTTNTGTVKAVYTVSAFSQSGSEGSATIEQWGYTCSMSTMMTIVAGFEERRVGMLTIRGVYEVAIRVKDLQRSLAFYRDVLGLEEGLRDEQRPWVFLRAGGHDGMIVLQEDTGEWPTQHVAFTVEASHIEAAADELRKHGMAVRGPVFHEWMPATSVYFADPDGHALELCAPGNKT
jgi:lactoylglutathione lyase